MPSPFSAAIPAIASIYGASQAGKSGSRTREAAEAEARKLGLVGDEARAFSEKRYQEGMEMLQPYMEGAETGYGQLLAEMGLGPGESQYMESPFFQSLEGGPEIDELLYQPDQDVMALMEQSGLDVAQQGLAGAGELYGGTRFREMADIGARNKLAALQYEQGLGRELATERRGLETQRRGERSTALSNYMNTLQNIANPETAKYMAGTGIQQGLALGQQDIDVQKSMGDLILSGQMSAEAGKTAGLGMGMDFLGDYMKGSYANIPSTPAPVVGSTI